MVIKDFFDNLYYCRYRPYERKFTPTPAQLEIESKIQSERDYFASVLAPADYQRFLNLEDLYTRFRGHDDIAAFAYGLRFGARFMDAVLSEDDIQN